jgi:hypothetical protein
MRRSAITVPSPPLPLLDSPPVVLVSDEDDDVSAPLVVVPEVVVPVEVEPVDDAFPVDSPAAGARDPQAAQTTSITARRIVRDRHH